jgi:hypothetical protein
VFRIQTRCSFNFNISLIYLVVFLNLRNNPLKSILIGFTFVAGLGVATGILAASGNTIATFFSNRFFDIHDIICLENNCMAYTCWFSSWDVVRAVAILNNKQLFLISFYIVISYKDNDLYH